MTPTERNTYIGKALVQMAQNFGSSMSELLLEKWIELLAPYSVEEVLSAVDSLIESYTYKTLPPFAELRRFLPGTERTLAREELSSLKARQEFDAVWDAIQAHGINEEPSFQPTTAAVLRSMGGWKIVCETWQDAERMWKERDFCALWRLYEGKEHVLGNGAKGVAEGIEGNRIPLPEQSANALPAPSHAPAGVCPDCEGAGYIIAYRSDRLTGNAFPCHCNKKAKGRLWTRAELSEYGWSFKAPVRQHNGQRMSYAEFVKRRKAVQSGAGL